MQVDVWGSRFQMVGVDTWTKHEQKPRVVRETLSSLDEKERNQSINQSINQSLD